MYGILAWYMPQTYSNELNTTLKEQTQRFITELEQVSIENSGSLFDQFLLNENVLSVELYNEDGQQISCPSNITIDSTFEYKEETTFLKQPDEVPILSNSYYFSFLNDDIRYMLFVNGEAAQIAELQRSFLDLLPILLVIVTIIAFVFAWLYSLIITKPVLHISRISKEMSDMKLDWRLDGQRSDELGILEKSLNTLSQNLLVALSELQNANEQLRADIEYEKKLEQVRIDFFSAVSHELKTPITIIKGQLEGMLLGIGDYKNHQKYLERSLEVVNILETMVQEILIISRLETKTDLKKETFDCVPIIRNYLSETEDAIIRKELQIQDKIPTEALLFGNKMLMEKVFSNLIGNAIKYAPEGGKILIIVKQEQPYFLFSIENTGNISNEYIPKLFDAFYRIEQSRNRKTGGSGLGLYIVQKILEQHGSTCHVCNTSSGVQFSFEMAI